MFNTLCVLSLSDSWWGKWSFPLNMFRTFGWNAGKTFLDKLRDIMKEKTGEPDITFLQVKWFGITRTFTFDATSTA